MKKMIIALALIVSTQSFAGSTFNMDVNITRNQGYSAVNYKLDGNLPGSSKIVFTWNLDSNADCEVEGPYVGLSRKYIPLDGGGHLDPNVSGGITACESFDCFDCYKSQSIHFTALSGTLNTDASLCKKVLNTLKSSAKTMRLVFTKESFKENHCRPGKEEMLHIVDIL
jgi:hypothetical protein